MLDGNFLCDSAIQLRWVDFRCWMGTGQQGLSDEQAKNGCWIRVRETARIEPNPVFELLWPNGTE